MFRELVSVLQYGNETIYLLVMDYVNAAEVCEPGRSVKSELEPNTVRLRQAGGGRRPHNTAVVADVYGKRYLAKSLNLAFNPANWLAWRFCVWRVSIAVCVASGGVWTRPAGGGSSPPPRAAKC